MFAMSFLYSLKSSTCYFVNKKNAPSENFRVGSSLMGQLRLKKKEKKNAPSENFLVRKLSDGASEKRQDTKKKPESLSNQTPLWCLVLEAPG